MHFDSNISQMVYLYCCKAIPKQIIALFQEIQQKSNIKYLDMEGVSDEEDLCSFINVPDVLIDKTVEVFLKSKAKLILEKKSLHSNYIFRIQI